MIKVYCYDTDWPTRHRLWNKRPYRGGFAGIPQAYVDGGWKSACDRGGDHHDVAKVYCKQLELPYKAANGEGGHAGPNEHFWIDDLKCHGTEDRVEMCYEKTFRDYCDGEHTKIYCTDQPAPTEYRLGEKQAYRDGYSGFIQGKQDGEWKYACAHRANMKEVAEVFCKQMGLPFESAEAEGSQAKSTDKFWITKL
jgi:hypothetical protein